MKQTVTDEEIDRINSLYDSGKKMEEIALEVYLSKSTVYRYVKNPRKTRQTAEVITGTGRRTERSMENRSKYQTVNN